MKTLRETIDQLDEISRRGFLQGAGAAAVAGAVGGAKDAEAHWTGPNKQTDRMTDRVTTSWSNKSTDGSATLLLKHDDPNGFMAVIVSNDGQNFRRGAGPGYGRIRIDGGPVIEVDFLYYSDSNQAIMIVMRFNPQTGRPEGPNPGPLIQRAKREVLVDVGSISNKGVLEFPIDRVSESVNQGVAEESSPDALAKIDELSK